MSSTGNSTSENLSLTYWRNWFTSSSRELLLLFNASRYRKVKIWLITHTRMYICYNIYIIMCIQYIYECMFTCTYLVAYLYNIIIVCARTCIKPFFISQIKGTIVLHNSHVTVLILWNIRICNELPTHSVVWYHTWMLHRQEYWQLIKIFQ